MTEPAASDHVRSRSSNRVTHDAKVDQVYTAVTGLRRLLSMVVTVAACGGTRAESNTVSAGEFRLTDGRRTRASLGLENGSPVFALFDERGNARLKAALDLNGRPSVTLLSSDAPSKALAVLETDEKGAHVLLRGPGRQESYLFQKSDGTAGVVLVDSAGTHRGEFKLAPNGDVDISLFDGTGKVIVATTLSPNGAVQRTGQVAK